MGLDCSHGAWNGSYNAFRLWREKIAEVAGLPPLELMEGFYEPLDGSRVFAPIPTLYHENRSWKIKRIDCLLPIKWECLKPDPLHELLNHSDQDGEIAPEYCESIAESLEKLIPLLPDEDCPGHRKNWKDTTQAFVNGLRLAASLNEPLIFG